uniref:Uncharacterized protein n=1 Tax=Naja naja TaxID=35670 RepID=A0A8C6Y4A4_NAJNA
RGGVKEPSTPGQMQNPFESPGDVRHLQEQTVCSPSPVAKCPNFGHRIIGMLLF